MENELLYLLFTEVLSIIVSQSRTTNLKSETSVYQDPSFLSKR